MTPPVHAASEFSLGNVGPEEVAGTRVTGEKDAAIPFDDLEHPNRSLLVPPPGGGELRAVPGAVESPEMTPTDQLLAVHRPDLTEMGPLVRTAGLARHQCATSGAPHHHVLRPLGFAPVGSG